MRAAQPNDVAGLFAGIGGLEHGLHLANHSTRLLCEIDSAAQAVLDARFPNVERISDVRTLKRLPNVQTVTAGFPCQDLSQAGGTAGIRGTQSGLVGEVFRLLKRPPAKLRWVVLENVPFMLQLERGRAMDVLVTELEDLGFRWAYRVVDTRAFGLPQRRQRVILVASKKEDPRTVLFADEAGEQPEPFEHDGKLCGFYWTEGLRGLGWAVDAVPTLKGGSSIGIPSPPAIWNPHTGSFGTPDIRDAERLQGFPVDWTLPAVASGHRKGSRWKLTGNAVSVPLASWVGNRLIKPGAAENYLQSQLTSFNTWPKAACGEKGHRFAVDRSRWPLRKPVPHLADFLAFPLFPLSQRAGAGFLARLRQSGLRHPKEFATDLETHLRQFGLHEAAA